MLSSVPLRNIIFKSNSTYLYPHLLSPCSRQSLWETIPFIWIFLNAIIGILELQLFVIKLKLLLLVYQYTTYFNLATHNSLVFLISQPTTRWYYFLYIFFVSICTKKDIRIPHSILRPNFLFNPVSPNRDHELGDFGWEAQ